MHGSRLLPRTLTLSPFHCPHFLAVIVQGQGRVWRDPGSGKGMRRREFITLIGGAAAWPVGARAQQPERMRRIGVMMGVPERNQNGQAWLSAFIQGLAHLGWTI